MGLKIGDKIPEILGVDANGNEVTASHFNGKKLVIYFYPKDNTPGCTAEACSFASGYSELRKAGYEIIGVSKDSVASHRKFSDKYSFLVYHKKGLDNIQYIEYNLYGQYIEHYKLHLSLY